MSCFCYSTTVRSTNSKNQCRDAGDDCHHRSHNYDGTCAPASTRQSLRIRSYCLFTICEPSDDLSFHLVHRCNQMHALTQAWLKTSAMSSSVTFASPLSTPLQRKTSITCLSFQTGIYRLGLPWPNNRECKAKSTRKMAKSSKLVAVKRGRILLVRRRRDQLWMFPGGQKRVRESKKDCLRREIKEELPKLKLGRQ